MTSCDPRGRLSQCVRRRVPGETQIPCVAAEPFDAYRKDCYRGLRSEIGRARGASKPTREPPKPKEVVGHDDDEHQGIKAEEAEQPVHRARSPNAKP